MKCVQSLRFTNILIGEWPDEHDSNLFFVFVVSLCGECVWTWIHAVLNCDFFCSFNIWWFAFLSPPLSLYPSLSMGSSSKVFVLIFFCVCGFLARCYYLPLIGFRFILVFSRLHVVCWKVSLRFAHISCMEHK